MPDVHERSTVVPPPDLDGFDEETLPAPRGQEAPAQRLPLPSFDDDFDLDDAGIPTAPPPPERATITNEVEMEAARQASEGDWDVSLPAEWDPGPRPATAPPSSLETRGNLLSLANDRVLSPPPAMLAPPALPTSTRGPRAPASAPAAAWSADPVVEMRERFSLGDYTGALNVAEEILGGGGASHAEASACAESCRAVLVKMYTARMGPLDRIPVVTVAPAQLRWLSIDHRAGFVLSHVDGALSLEMILDVSGMAPLDCLRILYELVQQRIIAFH